MSYWTHVFAGIAEAEDALQVQENNITVEYLLMNFKAILNSSLEQIQVQVLVYVMYL
jgi:hypothetical protein